MNTLEEYLSFARDHPAIFTNPPSAGTTIILDAAEIRPIERTVGQRLEEQGFPREWAQVGIAYRDQYVLLLRDAVRLPDGSVDLSIRSVDNGKEVPGVFVLPVHQKSVLLIRHFRHETRSWHLEIPGGFGVPGMSSSDSAQRELREEIGAVASRLIPLSRMYPNAEFDATYFELFYADVETYSEIEVQEGITEILSVSIQELERMILSMQITNMCVLVAYTRAKLRGLL